MKVLVFGGCGVVGSKLIAELICRKHQVTVVDIKEIVSNVQFDYLKLDRKYICTAKKYFENREYDIIYDFCCTSIDMMQETIKMFSGKVEHYILCSTVSVYDFNSTSVMPITEQAQLKTMECNDYGAEKAKCEHILAESGFVYTILRPCYIYGDSYHNDRIEYLVDNIIEKQFLDVANNLEIVLQFLNIDDLVAALLKVAFLPSAYNEVFNICADEYITLEGLIKLISSFDSKETNIATSINAVYITKLYNQSLIFSNKKIKQLVGWEASIDMYSGIRKLYEKRKIELFGVEE